MKSALVLIDIQNDFVKGGALAVPDGDAVVDVANEIMRNSHSSFDYVLASQDWHPPRHQSFASEHPGAKPGDSIDLAGVKQTLWPDHCVQGEHGSQFVKSLLISKIDEVFQKGIHPDRDSYSAFFDNTASFSLAIKHDSERPGDTGLNEWLKLRQVKNLTFLGLATDYCVLYSVMDAIGLGYQVTVVTDGCRSVDLALGDGRQALHKMKNAGARLITCSELISEMNKRKSR